MINKAHLLLCLLLMASFLMPGCSALPGTETVAERPPLRIEWTIRAGDYTMIIAEEKGFFEKHGVKVEPVFYETFSEAVTDFSAAQIDGGLFAIDDVITVSRATDPKLVAVYDSGGASTIVATKEIATISDLRGKRVGVALGTSGDMFLRRTLLRAGMTINDVELVNVDPENVTQELSNGEVVAGYVWAPYDQDAVAQGHKVLFSQTTGMLFPDVIVFRGDVARERPEDISAFLDAWFEAVQYRQDHPGEAAEIIARRTELPVEDVKLPPELNIYTKEDNQRIFDRSVSDEHTIFNTLMINLDFKISRGDITLLPNLDDIIDPSFLD